MSKENPGQPNLASPQDMMRMVSNIKERFEATVEFIAIQAKLFRASYEALIDQGFTEDQALDLVKARGTLLN
ncbi:hypothetical protein LCGC14_1493380 [marine sediment metagenome]|uniref:Uncharacterized protein n=1 Tax=marine sediment metagenome TaxID=412755 RepID=A0A0F9J646_9ZZZZ